jgi:hypothetical protein
VRRPAFLAALALSLAACGGEKPPPPFTFVPVAGMSCADGSPTGVGLSRGGDAVLVFLNGGGACWAAGACDASAGPFGAAELAAAQLLVGGTILDRKLPGNPFAGFTVVFVPYCTGDVHAGESEQTYGGVTWRHHGHRNVEAALDWIAASLPRPSRVVVAGSSAGGFGALLAFDLVRARWPEGDTPEVGAALVDDSGPTFVGTAIPASLRNAWWDAWNLASTVPPSCTTCQDDLSALWPTLSAAHPSDRLALLSTTADATMRGFFSGMTGLEFEGALAELALELESLPNARTFRVGDPARATDHALLAAPALYSAQGTSLLGWLAPLATGNGGFTSAGP